MHNGTFFMCTNDVTDVFCKKTDFRTSSTELLQVSKDALHDFIQCVSGTLASCCSRDEQKVLKSAGTTPSHAGVKGPLKAGLCETNSIDGKCIL